MPSDYTIPTFEELLDRMLADIPASLDKREGSMIYNALAPAAAELAQLYTQLNWIVDQSFPDTAERQFLVRRAIERGLRPYKASAAVVRAKIEPDTLVLPPYARFNLDEVNFQVIENETEAGSYKLQAEDLGVKGNFSVGELLPIEYIQGLEAANITALLIPGEDEESTEEFRERYIKSFSGMPYGGNIVDYKGKAQEVEGVGAVKVIPIWDGGGTVKLILLGGDYTVASAELVQKVQEAFDPVAQGGKGVGIAPVGHRVTVEAAEAESLKLNMELSLRTGIKFLDVKAQLEELLRSFLKNESKHWADRKLVIRLSQIMHILLSHQAVDDVKYVTINGKPEDLLLPENKIPVLAELDNTGIALKKA